MTIFDAGIFYSITELRLKMLVNLENSVYKDEIQSLIKRAKPILVKNLGLTKNIFK